MIVHNDVVKKIFGDLFKLDQNLTKKHLNELIDSMSDECWEYIHHKPGWICEYDTTNYEEKRYFANPDKEFLKNLLNDISNVSQAENKSALSDSKEEDRKQLLYLWNNSYSFTDIKKFLDFEENCGNYLSIEGRSFNLSKDREIRYPKFQFENYKLIPGLHLVNSDLANLFWIVPAYNWLNTPQPKLTTYDKKMLSPLEWLKSDRYSFKIQELVKNIFKLSDEEIENF